MKAINYKMKSLIGLSILPREVLETCNFPENVLRLQKERQKRLKSKNNLHFLWKTRVKVSKVLANPLKTLVFVTPIFFLQLPLTTIMSYLAGN